MILAAQAHGIQAVGRIHVDAALGHKGADNSDAGAFAQTSQLFGGAAPDTAVARQNHRTLGGDQHLVGALDDSRDRFRTVKASRWHRTFTGVVVREVFREFDVHCTAFFHARDAYSLADDFWNGIGVAYRNRPFGNGFKHADHIHDLVRLFMQTAGRALTGQYQHGGAVHIGIGDAGNQV